MNFLSRLLLNLKLHLFLFAHWMGFTFEVASLEFA